jgi:hypothetical protein
VSAVEGGPAMGMDGTAATAEQANPNDVTTNSSSMSHNNNVTPDPFRKERVTLKKTHWQAEGAFVEPEPNLS